MSGQRTRNSAYDFLKCIGLTGIILAHVDPPQTVMMIRSFDVPLMVILSAILARPSYERKTASGHAQPLRYFAARFKRLVFPTWIFLVFFFLLQLAVKGRPESVRYYLATFALTRYGMNYVWIILIYLYIALLVPLFHRLGCSGRSALIVVLAYAVYELCWDRQLGAQSKLINTTFYYIIPYGALAFLGYSYPRMKARQRGAVMIAAAAVFAIFAVTLFLVTGRPQSVGIAKYPPRMYYLSYGIACSFALLLLCERFQPKFFDAPVIRFISEHSMWIYLWHILWLEIYDALRLPAVWPVKLLFVYVGASLTVVAVNGCLDLLERKRPIPALKYLRG